MWFCIHFYFKFSSQLDMPSGRTNRVDFFIIVNSELMMSTAESEHEI